MVKYILKMKQVSNNSEIEIPHDAKSLSIVRLAGDSVNRGSAIVGWFEKVKKESK